MTYNPKRLKVERQRTRPPKLDPLTDDERAQDLESLKSGAVVIPVDPANDYIRYENDSQPPRRTRRGR